MSDLPTEGYEPSIDELRRMVVRKTRGLQILSERVGMLTLENVELLTIIDELQTDLAIAHQTLADLKSSDDLLAQLGSDHGVVHAVPDQQPVPSG